ncbi:hypothetical protein BOX15_Mlig015141g2 [Macrostomum lignano]|uniref:Methyltransferase domain-containing protein n=1 Tax=Macrostomum lignano TaxID=282301 RepID=A0A267FSB8_9PLAT|nr:hypothetical protein BOX15_Mlig015141g2 [Macrostomum lignano]
MRLTRRKVLLSLLLLIGAALLFFYYAFAHSGLTTEPRLSARDFHNYHGEDRQQHGGRGQQEDESFESIRQQLDLLEHDSGLKQLAGLAAGLATAPVPTRRQPQVVHRFADGATIRVAGESAAAASLKLDSNSKLEDAEEVWATALGGGPSSLLTASCHPYRRFGPKGDGGWSVCLAGPFRPSPGHCLSVSFGVDKVWSYDDQVAQQLQCRSLAFDPSLTHLGNHTRTLSGVKFYRIGLYSKPGLLPGTNWTVDTLEHLLDTLAGGPDTVVDILKLDIEGAEWPALTAALDSNCLQRRVRQLLVELHSRESRPRPNEDSEVYDYAAYLNVLGRLRHSGFQLWRVEPNSADGSWFYSRAGLRKRRLCCYNAYFINTRFLPSVNSSQALMEDQLMRDLHSVRLRLPLKLLPDARQLAAAAAKSPAIAAELLYFDSLMPAVHADCPDWRRLGPATGDGGYDVCLTPPFGLSRDSCLVLSFGIGDQFGFEDALAGREFGCRVRMFDPSLTQLGEHKRGPRQWLHLVGLGGEDSVRKDTGWAVNSLQTILSRYGHSGDIVDLLKIDIEFDEWEALEAAAKDGSLSRVRQLILETHTMELRDESTGGSDYLRFARVWLGLYRLGFRQWRSRENGRTHFLGPSGRSRACCHEHSLININFM